MNKDYIVISSGLFKDHKEEEFILMTGTSSDIKTHTHTSLTAEDIRNTINTIFNERSSRRSQPIVYASAEGHRQFQEAIQRAVQDPVIFGTAGEHTTAAEEMWIDLRNETQTPEIDLSVMTEQEIINHFDTISNE